MYLITPQLCWDGVDSILNVVFNRDEKRKKYICYMFFFVCDLLSQVRNNLNGKCSHIYITLWVKELDIKIPLIQIYSIPCRRDLEISIICPAFIPPSAFVKTDT